MEKHQKKSKALTISKVTIWQGISAVLAVLFIISIYTGGFQGTSNDTAKNTVEAQPAQPRANTQPSAPSVQIVDMKAIVDDDDILGPEDAKVTIVEFSDFECPYCAAAAGTHQGLIDRFKSQDPSWEAAVPKLKELAKQGKIKFVYRDFPLSNHPNAQKAAEAAECAGEQGKFWEMHDALFEKGVSGGVASYKQFAEDLGLSKMFDDCLDSGEMAQEVKKDMADGQQLGISGTPGFIVNGKLVSGAQPFSAFEQIIEAELA